MPLQRFLLGGLTPELASALSARASWGQYLRWRPFPALDTGRPSCDQTLHKVKEQKGAWRLSVRRVSALSILGLPPVRAVLRTAVSCLCKNRREAGAFQRATKFVLGGRADLQSVFCPRWFGSCAILPLLRKRAYGRRCIQQDYQRTIRGM